MASCVKNIRTKNYQNLAIGFQVTVKNVGRKKQSVSETQCIGKESGYHKMPGRLRPFHMHSSLSPPSE